MLTATAICLRNSSRYRIALKHRSYLILPFLFAVIVFAYSASSGFAIATQSSADSGAAGGLQVWFDGTPELTILYPTFYQFNVAAETCTGLWITWVHWDFGDGSTLDVPFSAQSYVSDIRYHQYAQPGIYTVVVTAYDNLGDSGTAQITVSWTGGLLSDLGISGLQTVSSTSGSIGYQAGSLYASPNLLSATNLTSQNLLAGQPRNSDE